MQESFPPCRDDEVGYIAAGAYLLYCLDDLHVRSLGLLKKCQAWNDAAMTHAMGAAAARAARAAVDARSQAAPPYVKANGETVPRYAGVSYFAASAKMRAVDLDNMTAWLPAMLDADILPRELCRALVTNAEAACEVDRAVRRLVNYDHASLMPIHHAIER